MKHNRNGVGVNHNFLSVNILRMLLCDGVARQSREHESNKWDRYDFRGFVGFHIFRVPSSNSV